jgi:glycosyltransferase involved in cell wall biosynthesis
MVANLRPEKGHDTLLAAAPRILARYPDASFTFVGAGPKREALETLTRALGITDRVRFVGESRDPAPILAGHDLFVLPSRSEAFPNALIEAMATALPVVATDVGGIPEVVRPGVNGLLVQPDDIDALSDAVLALMDDPAAAAALGRTARADVERHYTIDRMVERFEQLYLAEIETHVWNRGNRRYSRLAA